MAPGGVGGGGIRREAGLFAALLAAGLACQGGEGSGPRTIERLGERSVGVECDPVVGFAHDGAVVEDLHAVSDTTFLVLLPIEREVRLYDRRLRPVLTVAFEKDGPRGVRTPRSAELVDDTLVYVADPGARSVRVLSRTGNDPETIRLDFSPDRVRAGSAGVVVSKLAMASRAGEDLVYLLDGVEPRPLGLPMEPYEDPRIGALGNMLELVVLADGSVVAAHQVVSSRAAVFRPRPRGGFDVLETTVPVAESERDRLGTVPEDLFERDDVEGLAAPVIAASSDLGSGDYLYLTRTGGRLESGGTEKAIVRARPDLSYVASYRLDVDAQDFVYLTRTRTALVVDDEAVWHRCAIP